MPHGDRFPDTSYKGIDSFTFKAPSDFIDKHSNWKKNQQRRVWYVKRTFYGNWWEG